MSSPPQPEPLRPQGAERESSAEETWVDFGALEEIPRGGARAVKTVIGEIGLFRTEDDRVFALDNLCPHKGARLSLGMIDGDLVTCPFHGWQYRLDTGHGADPGFGMTCTVPARVVDGMVQLRMIPSPW